MPCDVSVLTFNNLHVKMSLLFASPFGFAWMIILAGKCVMPSPKQKATPWDQNLCPTFVPGGVASHLLNPSE
jgi:hypothetical protein